MAVNNPTTNYSWALPVHLGSDDTWGQTLNEGIGEADPDFFGATLGSIDTEIQAVRDALTAHQNLLDATEDRVLALEGINEPLYARVHLTGSFTLPKNTATNPNWTVEDFDKGGFFDSGTPDRFTIPVGKDGFYLLRAQLTGPSWVGDADDNRWYELRIRRVGTGAVVAYTRVPWQNDGWEDDSGDVAILAEGLIEATEGEQYRVEITQSWEGGAGVDDAAMTTGSVHAFFEIYRFPSPAIVKPVFYSLLGLSGRWYRPGHLDLSTPTTATIHDGDIHYVPFMVEEAMSFDKAACEITGDAGPGEIIRIGVYQQGTAPDFEPGALLAETADIDGSSTGVKEADLAVTLEPNIVYWMAIAAKGGNLTIRAAQRGGDHILFHHGVDTGAGAAQTSTDDSTMEATIGSGWSSLPDPADLTGLAFSDVSMSAVAVRVV